MNRKILARPTHPREEDLIGELCAALSFARTGDHRWVPTPPEAFHPIPCYCVLCTAQWERLAASRGGSR